MSDLIKTFKELETLTPFQTNIAKSFITLMLDEMKGAAVTNEEEIEAILKDGGSLIGLIQDEDDRKICAAIPSDVIEKCCNVLFATLTAAKAVAQQLEREGASDANKEEDNKEKESNATTSEEESNKA